MRILPRGATTLVSTTVLLQILIPGMFSSVPRSLAYSWLAPRRIFLRQRPTSSRPWHRLLANSYTLPSATPNVVLHKDGFESSSLEFVEHVIVQAPNLTVVDIVDTVLSRRRAHQEIVTDLSATQLLALGAVWFLPADAPREPSLGGKPFRLLESMQLQTADYLRIHHHPRRFPAVHNYDWSSVMQSKSNGTTADTDLQQAQLPGVIVAQDDVKGYIVIDKPAGVPVHMTVDNRLENVAACLARARRQRKAVVAATGNNETDNDDNDVYVSTPQRLDQNTSGLLVVATSKPFANYFANLLAYKTQAQLANATTSNDNDTAAAPTEAIHKLYKCLVCLSQPPTDGASSAEQQQQQPQSVQQAYSSLQAQQGDIIRHFLEPSIRSPKRFVAQIPVSAASDESSWPECLLKIRTVGPLCALTGNAPALTFKQSLWESAEEPPDNCHAVVELEIELLTGRTHQIRGQLSAMGYSLVGDAQYGGAKPVEMPYGIYTSAPKLALQCCQLEFIDPDIRLKDDGSMLLTRSRKWNKFRIDTAWWTEAMANYQIAVQSVTDDEATTSAADMAASSSALPTLQSTNGKPTRQDLLPSRVQLSPGKNKYVLIKATHPDERHDEWFVKSATPSECGGAYHANVAQDLKEWIIAAGYDVAVTGGGRIDYRPDENSANVYGFSYGFGKGDHMKAAKIISELGIKATYDYSDEMY